MGYTALLLCRLLTVASELDQGRPHTHLRNASQPASHATAGHVLDVEAVGHACATGWLACWRWMTRWRTALVVDDSLANSAGRCWDVSATGAAAVLQRCVRISIVQGLHESTSRLLMQFIVVHMVCTTVSNSMKLLTTTVPRYSSTGNWSSA